MTQLLPLMDTTVLTQRRPKGAQPRGSPYTTPCSPQQQPHSWPGPPGDSASCCRAVPPAGAPQMPGTAGHGQTAWSAQHSTAQHGRVQDGKIQGGIQGRAVGNSECWHTSSPHRTVHGTAKVTRRGTWAWHMPLLLCCTAALLYCCTPSLPADLHAATAPPRTRDDVSMTQGMTHLR